MKINILDSSIFNKIAAGEVVEKPASIVKELVENCIDAKCKNIVVEIQNGGIDLIKVTDDGCGMDKEDLEKALLPHATSKISCVEDLEKIGTLGFRGEALASISAVADVEIISRTKDGEGGKITCIDTVISDPVEMGAPLGTTIIVTDLFKNIPARKKFLRKPKSEESDITSYIEKLIMANPYISIKYIVNGKIIYNSTGNNLKEAIYVVYGKQVLDNLTEIKYNYGNKIKVEGFISKPTYSKSNRNYQTLICNGRYIINQQISVAISNAYGSYMMKGQFPFYVLSLNIPIEDIDVNVHPNKLDVRFVNKQQIYSIFYNAVTNSLVENRTKVNFNEFTPSDIKNTTPTLTNEFLKNQTIKNIENLVFVKNQAFTNNTKEKEENLIELFENKNKNNEIKSNEDTLITKTTNVLKENKENLNKPFNTIFKNNDKPTKSKFDLSTDDGLEKQYQTMLKKSLDLDLISTEMNMSSMSLNKDESPNIELKKFSSFKDSIKDNELEKLLSEKITKPPKPELIKDILEPETKIIGTCFDTYLLVEKGDLFVIDQHAGHERLLYDELTRAIDNKRVIVQQLLVPYVFSVDTAEIDFIENNIQELEELGFEMKRIGEKEFSISGVPMILDGINLKNFIDNLLSETSSFLKLKSSDLVKDKLKSMSCKKAIKAGYKMTKAEIELLLKLTDERNTALMCPHGRPSVIRLTQKDFEKWFKRAV